MHAFHQMIIKGQSLCLSADRSIYWEQEKALIVSDLHFGKTGHFRKAGIAVPQTVFQEDMQRLMAQLQYFKPSLLIVVGDMFHSKANRELDLFTKWRNDFSSVRIWLVRGNHDILRREWYDSSGIEVFENALTVGSFCFQHEAGNCIADDAAEQPYTFSGHIHPGITISGAARQSLRFPCFYFTDTYCILPAFSRFTGMVSVVPQADHKAFAIVNNTLVPVG